MHRIKKTTSKQYEVLIDFLEKHPEIVHGKTSENISCTQRRALWDELTCCLNSTLSGPQKSCTKWQKTWSDFKHSVRVKAARCLKNPETFRELNDLELRVIQLCKWKSEGGLKKDSTIGEPDNNSTSEEKKPETLRELSDLELRVVELCKWESERGSRTELATEEPENNSNNEEEDDCIYEEPSTSSTVPQEEIVVPKILYVSSIDKEEAKEKKQDITLEDIKERLETQNNLITEGINFVREIAKSQKKIADAELLKAQALRDIASTFRDFLEGFDK